jgi:hypothetical protein
MGSTTLASDADILKPEIPKDEIPDKPLRQPHTRAQESDIKNFGSLSTDKPPCHPQKRKLDVDVSPPPRRVGKRAERAEISAVDVK